MRFYLAHLSVIADNMLHSRRCMDLSRLDIVALHYTHRHTHDSGHMGLGFEQVSGELGAPLDPAQAKPAQEVIDRLIRLKAEPDPRIISGRSPPEVLAT